MGHLTEGFCNARVGRVVDGQTCLRWVGFQVAHGYLTGFGSGHREGCHSQSGNGIDAHSLAADSEQKYCLYRKDRGSRQIARSWVARGDAGYWDAGWIRLEADASDMVMAEDTS
jgi:hypothetical protein